MRRVVLAVLALAVFLPSMAIARTQFACRADLLVRDACCCPPKKAKAPVQTTMQRECCKVVKHTDATPPVATEDTAQAQLAPVAVAIAPAAVMPPVADARLAITPRAQAPPLARSLVSQHCALLV
ncbi:MAG: hypothetical protein ACM31C_34730 [Acidobacteriota bacterium]